MSCDISGITTFNLHNNCVKCIPTSQMIFRKESKLLFTKSTANKRELLRFKTRFTYSRSGVLNQPQPLCLTRWQMEPLRTQDTESQSVRCGKDVENLWWKLVFSPANKETYFGERGEAQVTCLWSQNELSEPWHQKSGLLSYTLHRKTSCPYQPLRVLLDLSWRLRC